MNKSRSGSTPQAPASVGHRRNQSSADNYYEDVDPRFVVPSPPIDSRLQTQQTQQIQSSTTVPSSLMPGIASSGPRQERPVQSVQPAIETIDPSSSYESIQDGQRSPGSENSNMTSISQRGVNPNWRPPPDQQRPGQAHLGVPGRRPVQQQRDVLFNSNPDFEVPGGARSGRGPPPLQEQHGQAF